jgi:hypothetical protein
MTRQQAARALNCTVRDLSNNAFFSRRQIRPLAIPTGQLLSAVYQPFSDKPRAQTCRVSHFEARAETLVPVTSVGALTVSASSECCHVVGSKCKSIVMELPYM